MKEKIRLIYRADGPHLSRGASSKIENNNIEPAAGTAWTELKADLTAGDIDVYTKGEADKKFQPLGNYLPAGYSYSKAESNTNYQPKGNYAPAGNYAMKGDSYTKSESDARYLSKNNNTRIAERVVWTGRVQDRGDMEFIPPATLRFHNGSQVMTRVLKSV